MSGEKRRLKEPVTVHIKFPVLYDLKSVLKKTPKNNKTTEHISINGTKHISIY